MKKCVCHLYTSECSGEGECTNVYSSICAVYMSKQYMKYDLVILEYPKEAPVRKMIIWLTINILCGRVCDRRYVKGCIDQTYDVFWMKYLEKILLDLGPKH
jgi:hypothetical protein